MKTAREWNQFLIRFLISFFFWEAISIPLRSLLFSRYYYDPTQTSFFIPMDEVNWLVLGIADFILIFFLGLISRFARKELPAGILGGILLGIVFSLAAFVGPTLALSALSATIPVFLLWIWVVYLSLLTLVSSCIFCYEHEI